MTSHKEGGHIGVKWGRRWGRETEKYKKIMTSFIAIVPYFSYGTNTLGAQIPNTFGIQMARVCSYLEWFGFWMVKQDGHHLINHLLCRIRCIQFLFGQVSKSIGHQLPLFLLCTRENVCSPKWRAFLNDVMSQSELTTVVVQKVWKIWKSVYVFSLTRLISLKLSSALTRCLSSCLTSGSVVDLAMQP